MEGILNGNTLTIKLGGKVDSQNAAEIEKGIFDLIDENKPKKVILDIQELEYISSAGLRVVLKLKKTIADSSVINASLDVYDVFEMTGFIDIIDVKKAMREISIEGCEMIGKGGHGTVYRLDEDTIVKIYNEEEPFDEIEREVAYSKSAFVYGIPTAISYNIVKCGKCYGVMFELIKADTLSATLNKEPEKFEEYANKYANIVRTLHTTEANTEQFSSTKELYNKWADDMLVYLNQDEVDLLHRLINSIPDRKTFVHGDIHPKNVMVQDGELLFIDMADLTYGHPIFDYAGVALTHVMAGRRDPEISKRVMGIEYKTAVALWDEVIKVCFAEKSTEELEKIKNVIMGFAWMKYCMAPAVNKGESEELKQMLVKMAREHFLPTAEKFVGSVDF